MQQIFNIFNKQMVNFVNLVLKRYWLFLGLISIILLLPYLYSFQFIFPSGDDLPFALKIKELGRPGFIIDFFQNWSGRYFANTLIAIPGADMYDNFYLFRIMPVIFIFFLVFSIYTLFKEIFVSSIPNWKLLITAFTLIVAYITWMPEPFSALFWYCSSFYLPAVSFFLIFVKYVIRYFVSGVNNLKTLFLLFFFCFLVSGLIEIFIFFNFVIFGLIIFSSRFLSNERKWNITAIFLFLFSIILLILILIFSGNDNRVEVSSSEYSFLSSAFRALYDLFLLHYLRFFQNPLGWLTLIIALLTWEEFKEKSLVWKKLVEIPYLRIVIAGFFCFYLAHALSLYAAGYTLQGRVLNVTVLLFYLHIFLILSSLFNKFNLIIASRVRPMLMLLSIVLIGSGLMSKFSVTIIVESRYILPEFAHQLDQRHLIIDKARNNGHKEVIIPAITVNPRSFYLGEYDENVNFYNSQKCLSDLSVYYQIDVRLERTPDKLKH